MTSRERMRRFYAGEPVDRIPNGLGGCETAGMHLLAYDNLKRILGVGDRTNRMLTFMTNSAFEPEVLAAMGGDCILLASPRMCPARLWGPGARDEWKDQELWGGTFQVPQAWDFRTEADGTIWWDERLKCPPGGIYFDWLPQPQGSLPDLANQPDPEDFHPQMELPEESLNRLAEAARWRYENTPYSITVGETIHDLQLRPGGLQAWWMRMVAEPEVCHEFLRKATDAALSQLKQVHQAVGQYCDAMIMADDIGDTRGVTCGPELWRTIYKPHYQRLWTEWKKITPMRCWFHSCGSVVDLLQDFIDCGLDVLNPVQISARGMSAAELADRAAGRIILYGGALDAVVTPPGTPDEVVYETARQTIGTLASRGRYLFAGTHNIPGDTPPGHIAAMLRAYNELATEAASDA